MNQQLFRRIALVLAVALVALTVALVSADSGSVDSAEFLTQEAPMLMAASGNMRVKPLLTVGDTLPNGYTFETIPDGIAIDTTGRRDFKVYVNHETSTVPFPFGPVGGLTDFNNAQLSELTLRKGTGRVLDGRFAIPSDANYQRFCSNFYAGEAEGFDRPLVLVSEEATDLVNLPPLPAWPAQAGAVQAGRVVAYDPAIDQYRTILGMGRHNHENTVAIPGYDQAVVLSGDDTFSAPSSQMYMYLADDADAVWNDEGHLYAFVSDDPAVNDYGDLSGDDWASGTFIPVPDAIADGDQTGLENWSNANNVFQFIRVEDVAYDRTRPNTVYFADTGEPRAIPNPATGRLMRGPSGTQGPYPNGRIFRMLLDPENPLVVKRLSILVDGDAGGYGNPDALHNPDNIETTRFSVMIQEDPGSHNQYAANDPNGVAARVWRFNLRNDKLTVVAEVDQSADPAAQLGNWESSGIVDASRLFGRGAFLLTVQAHSIWIDSNVIDHPIFPGNPLTQKREGGQLILLRIPGA